MQVKVLEDIVAQEEVESPKAMITYHTIENDGIDLIKIQHQQKNPQKIKDICLKKEP